jgi:hypothetical protein
MLVYQRVHSASFRFTPAGYLRFCSQALTASRAATNSTPERHQHYESNSISGWPADLPSVTFGDLSIALAQAVGMPGSGGGDSLLGGQGRVDDRGSTRHVYRLEALHDWCGHLADLPRQLDGPIQQLPVCNDLCDQTHRLGPGRIDDLAGHREPAGHRGPDDVGQPRRHARTGQDAHPGMSVGEDRSVGRHKEVATECHLHTAGNRCSVYRPQHGLAELGGLGDAVLGVKPFEIGGPIALNLLEIKAGAAPVSTTARTEVSRSACISALCNALIKPVFNAFRDSGRFIVTTRTAPRSSHKTSC